MLSSLLFSALTQTVYGAPPPSTCDPGLINECLNRFEMQLSSCDENDLHCVCDTTIKTGASCYSACPQEAVTKFIQTYNDGKCANYDPYLSKRDLSEFGNLGVGNEFVKAITVTPSDPTTTISLSPQEYQSRLEKSRYKENLRSIRSERARISREAELARTPPSGVMKRESQSLSTPSTELETATPTSDSTKHEQTAAVSPSESAKPSKEKKVKNAGFRSEPLAALPAVLFALI